MYLRLLVDPVVLSALPALDLLGLEPQSNLLLGRVDGVGAVANVAADILSARLAIGLQAEQILASERGVDGIGDARL